MERWNRQARVGIEFPFFPDILSSGFSCNRLYILLTVFLLVKCFRPVIQIRSNLSLFFTCRNSRETPCLERGVCI